MASIFAVQYRVDQRRIEEVNNAARATLSLYTRLGAQASFRSTILGGEEAATRTVLATFPNAAERAAFMDEVIKPANVAENGLLQAARAADPPVTLLGRSWFNEVPPTEALPPDLSVLAVSRVRISPGRWADGEALLREWKQVQEAAGTEPHAWISAFAGSTSWTHLLATGAATFAELNAAGRRAMAYNAERGVTIAPFPRALHTGTWELISQTISRLVQL